MTVLFSFPCLRRVVLWCLWFALVLVALSLLSQLPDGVQLQNLEAGVFLLRLEPSEERIEWEKDEELFSYLKSNGDPYKEIDYKEECVVDFREDGTKVVRLCVLLGCLC